MLEGKNLTRVGCFGQLVGKTTLKTLFLPLQKKPRFKKKKPLFFPLQLT
jgi:hypothetical protein